MGKINVLDKSVAEKIAAGEVVERPGSIVKELAENSFDAGATSVTVEIEHGGTTYIRVTDNGTGIARDDVEKAFMRHATSKIRNAADLEKIGTLGFRGEALCSIGAVSKTELITKTAAEETGSRIVIEGGEKKDLTDAGCPTGTTVTVKNLFYNTPARMKFLKKDSVEAAYITDICQRAALSHPEISFRLIKDGRDVFFTPGDSVLKNAVRAIFGKDISNAMTEVDKAEGKYRIYGLTGQNSLSRPNRNMQFFFVNGRLVKSAVLSLAVGEAYKNELMLGKFPVCVLNIEMPPELVDVNVHPAKTEVKFSDDEEVYRTVGLVVRSVLTREAGPRKAVLKGENAYRTPIEAPKAKQEFFKEINVGKLFKKEEKKVEPLFKAESKKAVFTQKTDGQKAVFTQKADEKKAVFVSDAASLPKREVESLKVSEPEESAPEMAKAEAEEEAAPKREVPPFRVVGQLFSTYILLETEDSMIMIDQHAAHERINYERIKNDGCMKQTLLIPITASVSPREKAVWEDNREFFEKLGFEADDFGEGSVIIRTLPSDIDFADGEALFIETASALEGSGKGEVMRARERAVYTVACKAAIKANRELSEKEMEALAKEALSMEGISTCPHGRPISVELGKYKIEKMFKRII